ncbi:protein kinase-like protein [Aspergillus taichungensis]|uniref:non-specific serine/threonine protein kinase n=1 Tax=Aspergillus taichungensis TaxID=482145 RepID=A0A2J5HYX7_9EURO|nr:protein kinase-like protein [Aspergillus taichungensis]
MEDDGMTVVPYNLSNLDVVLRHNDSVVVLDRDSQQLVIRNTADDDDANLEIADCPYCRRPLRDGNAGQGSHHASPGAQPEFISPEYFRMLHNSLPAADRSNPPSPRRRFAQPALADGSSSGSRGVPTAQGISSGAFTQDYFKKFFVEESVLGKGGKGVVLLVKHVLDGVSLGHYACKRVPVGDDHEWLRKVLAEVQLLQHLSHQNLVSYRHVWLENAKISTFGPSVPCAFILQQFCNAGDLHNYICGSMQTSTTAQQLKDRLRRRSKGEPEPQDDLGGPRRLSFDEIYSFFRDITSGLRHLHVNGYIHRDLKPNNCLLHQTQDGIRVLVSDFGEVQSQDAMRRSTGATGTVSYCAPEVLRREYHGGPFGNFTFKSDIFSLGMILYFLCFAQLPYTNADIINEEKEDLDRLRDEISQWTGFDDARRMRPELPEQLYTFLGRLLSVDPDRRPSAEEVLNGLQAGANGNDSFRHRRASSSGSDPHSSSRIHPVDDPGASSFQWPSSTKRRFSQSPVAVRRNSYSTPAADLAPVFEDLETETQRRMSLSPERDLVIRHRFSGTPAPSESPRGRQAPDNDRGTPLPPLLPPPPGRFSFLRSLWPASISNIESNLSSPMMPLAFFLLKVATAFQPCTPLAVNPWVFYPLILLAAVHLNTHSLRLQVAALFLHLLIVGLCMRLKYLCLWPAVPTGMF